MTSILLSFLAYIRVEEGINRLLSPFTSGLLQLPDKVGIPLIFGVFKKELSLLMLSTALGTSNISALLSHSQILTFVIFNLLFIPCVATVGMIWKEGGWKLTLYSIILNVTVAVIVSGLVVMIANL